MKTGFSVCICTKKRDILKPSSLIQPKINQIWIKMTLNKGEPKNFK